jgi:hypothetical protein
MTVVGGNVSVETAINMVDSRHNQAENLITESGASERLGRTGRIGNCCKCFSWRRLGRKIVDCGAWSAGAHWGGQAMAVSSCGKTNRANRSRGAKSAIFALLAGAALAFVACTIDSNNRCDDREVLYGDTRCVCAEGFAMSDHGCVSCGDHEIAGPSGCGCAEGYARASAQAACVPKPSGQGDACDGTTACPDPVYSHCQITAGASGYCTSTGCASSANCTGGYACDATGAPAFCKRPPIGAGKACTSTADCAETEATFCETFMTHQCLVQGCTVAPNNCFEGMQCCDLSAFGLPQPICIPPGTCPS